MFTIAIEDLEMCLDNSNLLLKKTQFGLSYWLKKRDN